MRVFGFEFSESLALSASLLALLARLRVIGFTTGLIFWKLRNILSSGETIIGFYVTLEIGFDLMYGTSFCVMTGDSEASVFGVIVSLINDESDDFLFFY